MSSLARWLRGHPAASIALRRFQVRSRPSKLARVGSMFAVAAAVAGNSGSGQAAEFAQGVYLLGLGSSLAGFTPPPGIYFQMDNYFYSGQIGGGRQLSFGPAVGVDVRQRTWLNVPTALVVTPAELLGGNLAFAISAPISGVPSINPTIQVDFPRLNRSPGASVTEAKYN